jgi:uncharacterized membrane protein
METLKKFLQGKWLGHPLHPAVVHVPTGLWPAAVIFDILSHIMGDPVATNVMVRLAFWSLLVGLVTVLVAAPTGLADWWEIKKERPAYTIGLIHAGLNVLVAVIVLVSVVLRWGDTHQPATGVWPMVLAIVGVLILSVSGYLGGLMVYEHGIGVARQSKQKWRRIAEAGNARLPEES